MAGLFSGPKTPKVTNQEQVMQQDEQRRRTLLAQAMGGTLLGRSAGLGSANNRANQWL
jgi:hypothetical protein